MDEPDRLPEDRFKALLGRAAKYPAELATRAIVDIVAKHFEAVAPLRRWLPGI
jgi:hypothetical protein